MLRHQTAPLSHRFSLHQELKCEDQAYRLTQGEGKAPP